MLTRREVLGSVPALGALARAQDRRMNVVFMVADDLNTALGCYGNRIVKTPNLDRLASRGVLFENAHCQFPLCAPSRASFLSGRRPETTRVWGLNTPTRKYMQDVVMLPEFFRKQGYFSAQVGKIYHTGKEHEDPRSWDYQLPEFGKNPPASEVLSSGEAREPLHHSMKWAKLKTPDEKTPDGIVARKASELIRKCAKEGKPFFMGVGFRRPHSPYAAPVKYFDLYDPARIPLPETPRDYRALPAALNAPEGEPKLGAGETRAFIAAYYACNSFMDAQAGVVFDTLEELKLWDNTAVVFLGDNGYHNGDHGGIWHKMTLFDPSTRVPLIAAAPGIHGRGQRCRGLVECIDLYPSLTELTGLAAPSGLEGRSMVPLLNQPRSTGKKAVFSIVGRNDDRDKQNNEVQYLGRSMRTEQWRYTEWDEGRRGLELYDLTRDPGELFNLALESKYRDIVEEFKAGLRSR